MIERENTQQEVPDTQFTKQLEFLDKSIEDPYVERIVKDAQLYNQLFAESTPTDADKQDAINELDRRWVDVMNSEVTVSGSALIPTANGDMRVVLVDGLVAETKGFGGRLEPQIVGGEKIGDVFRIGHYLHTTADVMVDAGYLTLDDLGIEEDEADISERLGALRVGFAADVDHSIVELSGVSYERARSWIEVSCPGLLDELDSRLLNEVAGGNEPVYALRGLDLSEYIAVDDDFTQTCIETHLNGLMSFDRSVPYSVEVQGQMLGYDDEEGMSIYQVDDLKALAFMRRVYIVTSPFPEEGEAAWQFAVETQILGSNSESTSVEYMIPIDSLESVQSLRRNFFGN